MDNYEEKIRELRGKQQKERESISKKLMPGYKEKWVGKCFKFRNSYGGDDKGWWLYAKIVSVSQVNFIHDGTPEPNFVLLQFQKCSDSRVEFEAERLQYRMNGWQKITSKAFDKEFKKVISHVTSLNKP